MVGDDELVERLLARDASLFVGATAAHSLGWLNHPERYLSEYLDTLRALPRHHERTLLLGMGGVSSSARFFAQSRSSSTLSVIDTSNPDTVSSIDFRGMNVIASSKSGTTIETQTLLAHALAHGLDPRDLVVITDPGSSLEQLALSLGAAVFLGDPESSGRFSGLSPFGLIPALYAGWTPEGLREELSSCALTNDLVTRAVAFSHEIVRRGGVTGGFFELGADPTTSGAALWLEQLVAETTGKRGRGYVPVVAGPALDYRVRDIMFWHLVAAMLALWVGVDPFDQPDVESAKQDVFALLRGEVSWVEPRRDLAAMDASLAESTYVALQVYAPLSVSQDIAALRERVQSRFGTTTANLGPRSLHSTGQLHKGGPAGVVALQIVQRPLSAPVRIEGRRYSFHDLHMAQARSDISVMRGAGREIFQVIVDDLAEARWLLNGAT